MEVQTLNDKSKILSYLQRNRELQVYCIGDLDDFFWPYTTWYALTDEQEIVALALIYHGAEMPALLSFYEGNPLYHIILMERIKSDLPERFTAHLTPGLIEIFGWGNVIEDYGLHYKMALRRIPDRIFDLNIRSLTVTDLAIILDLYRTAYPDNWFDKRMLETGKYFGYFINNRLAGVAGIHVYSAEFKVAALGNIATLPEFRGRGIGSRLTSELCNNLLRTVDVIGLNVKSDNSSAIKCYQLAGFDVIGNYNECLIRNI